MVVTDVLRADDPFRARSGQALVRVRNPGDGRPDQLVMQVGERVAWAEVTPDQAVRLAEDLLRSAREMTREGRTG